MATASFTVDTPEALSDLFQVIQGVGKVVSVTDNIIRFEIEADDDYELGATAKELELELRTHQATNFRRSQVRRNQ